jgi:IS605 OrfB family transposase|tara:strand:- start:2377 stop:3501 length:1125 start_codon:yes stop_codon:yes gene_type:complete
MECRVSVPIKLKINEVVVKTIEIYKKSLQHCVDVAWEMKIKNNVELQPFVYKEIRNFGLPSQLAIACIKQSCGIIKKAKSNPNIYKTSIRYNSPRSFSFKNNVLSISTIKGRIKIPIKIPNYALKYFKDWNIKESLLTKNFKGDYYFTFTFLKKALKNSTLQNRVLGVDLGIHNLAVTSDKQFFKSFKVKQIKRKFKFLRDKLQAKGTRSSRRLLKKLSGKEKRFMTWVNHNISKEIISVFDGNKIVMENLKGIRKIWRGKRMNYCINNWSFLQLQNFIQYKAEIKGIEVVRVKPHYTSQLCSKCEKLGSRSGSSFVCHCGYSLNADLNASFNLASPMLEKRQALVTKPCIQTNEHEGVLNPIECEVMDKIPLL